MVSSRIANHVYEDGQYFIFQNKVANNMQQKWGLRFKEPIFQTNQNVG